MPSSLEDIFASRESRLARWKERDSVHEVTERVELERDISHILHMYALSYTEDNFIIVRGDSYRPDSRHDIVWTLRPVAYPLGALRVPKVQVRVVLTREKEVWSVASSDAEYDDLRTIVRLVNAAVQQEVTIRKELNSGEPIEVIKYWRSEPTMS